MKDNIIINEETNETISSKTTVAVLENEKITELNIQEYTYSDIQGMIHKIRGQRVILDSDLTKLFNYELKKMNQQVKRNIDRFKNDSMFQLKKHEIIELQSQNVTTNINKMSRSLPYVFTKKGIELLGAILKKGEVKKNLPLILDGFEKINNNKLINNENIQNPFNIGVKDKIYTFRGQEVMLDFDLAPLYNYEVKRFNEQVNRNLKRFYNGYMFELTDEETLVVSRSQFATSIQTKGVKGGRTHAIKAFTEKGILALSSVLHGEIALQQSYYIIEQFILMRETIKQNQYIKQNELNHIMPVLLTHEEKINTLQNVLNNTNKDINEKFEKLSKDNQLRESKLDEILCLFDKSSEQFVFYKGSLLKPDVIYKAIFEKARHTIYVIDNYINFKTLSHLSCKKENVKVILFTKNRPRILRKIEVDDFNKEYLYLTVKPNNEAHDRYIIIDYKTDDEKIYHSGPSVKDAGKTTASLTKLSDSHIYHNMIDELLKQEDLDLS
ncbi:MAG: ORF6N domain-containing protein [Coprobacillus sp.]